MLQWWSLDCFCREQDTSSKTATWYSCDTSEKALATHWLLWVGTHLYNFIFQRAPPCKTGINTHPPSLEQTLGSPCSIPCAGNLINTDSTMRGFRDQFGCCQDWPGECPPTRGPVCRMPASLLLSIWNTSSIPAFHHSTVGSTCLVS